MNIPNILTVVRILLIPVLVVVILTKFQGSEIIAFVTFLLAVLTDSLDGHLARRRKQITALGQLLDPVADKLLITSVFICLVQSGSVPAWMAVIIIGREMAVTGFRAIASSKGIIVPALRLGKIKMLLETITVCLLLLGEKILGNFFFLSQVGLWLVIVAALVSAAEYYLKFGPRILSKQS